MANANIPRLAAILEQYPDIGRALQYLQGTDNNIAQQTNASPVGVTPPPQPHSKISVLGGGGLLDISLTDNSPQYRGQEHFFDYSQDGFKTFHTKSLGPAKNWRGTLGKGKFQIRSYTQHATSGPSAYLNHPEVDTSGDTEPPMQPGQGSGTGTTGYGAEPFNTNTPPKRA